MRARLGLACIVASGFIAVAIAAPTLASSTLSSSTLGAQTATRWYVGEKVVCVNNRFLDLADAPELAEGGVYTIREVLPPRRGFLGLAVDETPARTAFQAFDERRFRPLDLSADRSNNRTRLALAASVGAQPARLFSSWR